MATVDLAKASEATEHIRWFVLNSRVGEMETALRHYDRDGRIYSSEGLRWAAGCLRNGCELLMARPNLSRDNLRATPQILAHLALADGPLSRSAFFPVDRLCYELRSLMTLLLHDLLTGLHESYGMSGAPRDAHELQQRIGATALYDLRSPMLRLAGAFQATQPPMRKEKDHHLVADALIRCGALRRGKRAEDLVERLAASFAVAERQTGGMATLAHLMRHLERAYSLLLSLLLLPANARDAEFRAAKAHWMMTGEFTPAFTAGRV